MSRDAELVLVVSAPFDFSQLARITIATAPAVSPGVSCGFAEQGHLERLQAGRYWPAKTTACLINESQPGGPCIAWADELTSSQCLLICPKAVVGKVYKALKINEKNYQCKMQDVKSSIQLKDLSLDHLEKGMSSWMLQMLVKAGWAPLTPQSCLKPGFLLQTTVDATFSRLQIHLELRSPCQIVLRLEADHVKLRRFAFRLGRQADQMDPVLSEEDCFDDVCQKDPQGISCWVLPDLRSGLVKGRSQIIMDASCQEAQLACAFWKQQYGYDIPMDCTCLLEVQLSEELDKPCKLVPQCCVWLSAELAPEQHASMEGNLMAELHQTAGLLASFDPSPWGPEALKVEISDQEAFRLPSPTEGVPSSGWLPANKLPPIHAPPANKLHPLATGIKRLPLSAISGHQASSNALQTPAIAKLKPKVPRAEVGTALQTFLAHHALLQAPKSAPREPNQKVHMAIRTSVKAKANDSGAPMFAKRNNALPGASKPAQNRTLASKQEGGTSAKRPPLPAKRALPASRQQDKKAAPVKRPKPTQKPASSCIEPHTDGVSVSIADCPANQNMGGSSIPAEAQPLPGHANVFRPASNEAGLAGREQAGDVPDLSRQIANAAGGQVHETAAARKRTQMADVDVAAVEAKVASLRSEGKLSSLTVPELKTWLKARKLPVGGKKADLVLRLENTLGLALLGAA
ncbi:hypothetical protein WJX74_006368 [Apatococcus lobatus]|uniref:SAP domain-containing protein n=1 Tax=Apatococcus lobatus TaxID=904363 RepID=A0AAW1RHB2_9CHLO